MVRGTKMMKVVKTMRSMEIHDTFDSMDNLTVHGTSHSLPEEQCKQLKYIKRAPSELFLCAQRALQARGCSGTPSSCQQGSAGAPPPCPKGRASFVSSSIKKGTEVFLIVPAY